MSGGTAQLLSLGVQKLLTVIQVHTILEPTVGTVIYTPSYVWKMESG